MSALQMFTNDVDYVIAESADEARTILRGCYGELTPEEIGDLGVMPGNKTFKLEEENGEIVNKTIDEWITEKGRGYFACSDF